MYAVSADNPVLIPALLTKNNGVEVESDLADLAGVFYFEQSYLGGTAFFENHFDPIPDITIGAYTNRLILYNGNRWHAPCADYTFEERYIIAFMVDIIK